MNTFVVDGGTVRATCHICGALKVVCKVTRDGEARLQAHYSVRVPAQNCTGSGQKATDPIQRK